mgnify:CR=1 FL=1
MDTYLGFDSHDDEVIKGLKVLWREILLSLQLLLSEIQEASIRQHTESAVPSIEERRLLLLLQDTDLADATEIVSHDSVSEARVSLLSLIFESPVPHKQLF